MFNELKTRVQNITPEQKAQLKAAGKTILTGLAVQLTIHVAADIVENAYDNWKNNKTTGEVEA